MNNPDYHARFPPHLPALCGKLLFGVRMPAVGFRDRFAAVIFRARACHLVGIDLSQEGIDISRKTHPQRRLEGSPALLSRRTLA